MTGLATVIDRSNAPSDGTGELWVSPAMDTLAELLIARGGRLFWAENVLDSDGWTCHVSGLQAVPAPAVASSGAHGVPDIFASGGPDNGPYGEGKSSDPVGILLTPGGTDVFDAAANWTVAMVANDGSSSSACAFGIVGNNGGALTCRLRTSNILEIATYVGSTPTVRWTGNTIASATWHSLEISCKAGVIGVTKEGAAVTPTAQSTITGWTPGTKRLALFGGFDLVIDLDREGRDLALALVMVVPGVALSDDAELRAAYRAVVEELYPSLLA